MVSCPSRAVERFSDECLHVWRALRRAAKAAAFEPSHALAQLLQLPVALRAVGAGQQLAELVTGGIETLPGSKSTTPLTLRALSA